MTDLRTIRINGEIRTVPYREAVGLVSRRRAEFVTEEAPARRRGRPKGSKNKPKPDPVSAEQVYADPTSPITPQELPDPAPEGDAVDSGSNSPSTLD